MIWRLYRSGKKSRETGSCGRKGNVVAWNACQIAGRSNQMCGATADKQWQRNIFGG